MCIRDRDSDDDNKAPEILPEHKVRFTDMTFSQFKEVLKYAEQACKEFQLDKDIATQICKKCKESKVLGWRGEGEWQCLVGKNFTVSLNYDNRLLAFFDLKEIGKTFLVFKSG
eukprot:TRINITY_DN2115_c0_g1_i6.p2 TRINITY_DN2115_c0_g1~~TRINITY_DN2115_c0_g1_i6.p2  ORF type:complete len:113 (+),score=20.10 TRINITY_DN2115_c0_g1_i6:65-403(+)